MADLYLSLRLENNAETYNNGNFIYCKKDGIYYAYLYSIFRFFIKKFN